MQTAAQPAESQPTPSRRERRSRAVDRMTGIAVRAHGSGFVASFDLDGAHYFLWLRQDGTRAPADTLHKGPPPDMRRDDPNWFKPTYCKPGSKANAPLVAKLIEAIEREDLIAKARAEQAAKEQREIEFKRETAGAYAKSEAGELLYDTLKELLRCTAIPDHWAEPARRMMADLDVKVATAVAKVGADE